METVLDCIFHSVITKINGFVQIHSVGSWKAMSNRKLFQEDVEESLYRAAVLKGDDGSTTSRGVDSVSESEVDDDSCRGLKQSPAFQDDDEEGWNQTATFYPPHPALTSGENSSTERERNVSGQKL
jgi:hypothetical protein